MRKQILEGYMTYIGAFIVLTGGFVAFILDKVTFVQFDIILGLGIAIIGIRRAIKR